MTDQNKAQHALELVKRIVVARVRILELEAQLEALIDDGSGPKPLPEFGKETLERRVFSAIVDCSPRVVTASILAAGLKVPATSVNSALAKLFDKGLVSRVSHGCYALVGFR